MVKSEPKILLNKELLIDLPIQFLFPVLDQVEEEIPQIFPSKSTFYQTNASICYAPNKPISKII